MKSVLSKFDIRNIPFYGVFALLFCWDIIETHWENMQYVILVILFLIDVLNKKKIKINKIFLIIAIACGIQGLINVYLGNDTLWLVAKQLGVISVCFICYANILSGHNIKEIFMGYWWATFLMASWGIIELITGIISPNYYPFNFIIYNSTYLQPIIWRIHRLSCLVVEPSFLAYYFGPAICVYLFSLFLPGTVDKDLFKGKHVQNIIIIIVYLLTFSSTAYFGLGIMCVLIILKTKGIWKKVILFGSTILLFVGMYLGVSEFRIRVDDTVGAFFKPEMVKRVNASSYTLYSCNKIGQMTLSYTHGVGSGLGSYEIMYDKFVDDLLENDILTIKMSKESDWPTVRGLCRMDGNSMFNRIMTELGVVGIVLVVYYLIKFYVKGQNKYAAYSCGIVAMFMMLLLRMGNYVHAGTVMFYVYYVQIYKECNNLQFNDFVIDFKKDK